MPSRNLFVRKRLKSPGRLKLVKRPRRKKHGVAATLISIIEPAHLAAHGVHRLERTGEAVSRRLEKIEERFGGVTRGVPGQLLLQIGETVELEDMNLDDDLLEELQSDIQDIMNVTGTGIITEAEENAPFR